MAHFDVKCPARGCIDRIAGRFAGKEVNCGICGAPYIVPQTLTHDGPIPVGEMTYGKNSIAERLSLSNLGTSRVPPQESWTTSVTHIG